MSKPEEKKEDPQEEQGLDADMEVELQLKSQDMLTFKVNKDVVMQSALIKTMWSGKHIINHYIISILSLIFLLCHHVIMYHC